jgi:hypothetical protein
MAEIRKRILTEPAKKAHSETQDLLEYTKNVILNANNNPEKATDYVNSLISKNTLNTANYKGITPLKLLVDAYKGGKLPPSMMTGMTDYMDGVSPNFSPRQVQPTPPTRRATPTPLHENSSRYPHLVHTDDKDYPGGTWQEENGPLYRPTTPAHTSRPGTPVWPHLSWSRRPERNGQYMNERWEYTNPRHREQENLYDA